MQPPSTLLVFRIVVPSLRMAVGSHCPYSRLLDLQVGKSKSPILDAGLKRTIPVANAEISTSSRIAMSTFLEGDVSDSDRTILAYSSAATAAP